MSPVHHFAAPPLFRPNEDAEISVVWQSTKLVERRECIGGKTKKLAPSKILLWKTTPRTKIWAREPDSRFGRIPVRLLEPAARGGLVLTLKPSRTQSREFESRWGEKTADFVR